MLNRTCWLFLIPTTLGYLCSHSWSFVGCGILTCTSALYYNLHHTAFRYIDTCYAATYTIVSTVVGAAQCNVVGVAMSGAAIIIYITKSKRGEHATHDDPWHALVHVVGAAGLSTMPLYKVIHNNSSHAF